MNCWQWRESSWLNHLSPFTYYGALVGLTQKYSERWKKKTLWLSWISEGDQIESLGYFLHLAESCNATLDRKTCGAQNSSFRSSKVFIQCMVCCYLLLCWTICVPILYVRAGLILDLSIVAVPTITKGQTKLRLHTQFKIEDGAYSKASIIKDTVVSLSKKYSTALYQWVQLKEYQNWKSTLVSWCQGTYFYKCKIKSKL